MEKILTKKTNKEKIMEAALQVFAEKGFQETTISEISKKAGVADATIYEYFEGKEDLLFSISETITQRAIDLTNEILPFMRDPESKVRAHVQIYMMAYEQNPHYAAVGMLELKTNRRFHLSKAYQTIKKGTRMFLDSIKEGIEAGVFRKDLDPYLMRSMLLGAIEHLCTRKHLLGIPMDLTSYTDPLVDLFLEGARVKVKEQKLSINLQISNGKITRSDKTDGKDEQ
jgi:TetR/AcrR family fatty acid metabolism transcriptional regulator